MSISRSWARQGSVWYQEPFSGKGQRIGVVLGPVLEDFGQWVLSTKAGLAAKACLDATSALRAGATCGELLAFLFGN